MAGACRAPEQLSGVLAAARTGAPLGSAGRSGQEQRFLKSSLARGKARLSRTDVALTPLRERR